MKEEKPGVFSESTKAHEREVKLIGAVHEILLYLVRADRAELEKLRGKAGRFLEEYAREGMPPAKPLEEAKVAFGYAMALADVAYLGERWIVPHEHLGFALKDENARVALEKLASTVTGVMRKDTLAEELEAEKEQFAETSNQLKQRHLVREERRGKEDVEVLVLTSSGQAVIDLLPTFESPAANEKSAADSKEKKTPKKQAAKPVFPKTESTEK